MKTFTGVATALTLVFALACAGNGDDADAMDDMDMEPAGMMDADTMSTDTMGAMMDEGLTHDSMDGGMMDDDGGR